MIGWKEDLTPMRAPGLDGISRPSHDPRQPLIDFRPREARLIGALRSSERFLIEQIRLQVLATRPDNREASLAWIKEAGAEIKKIRRNIKLVEAM